METKQLKTKITKILKENKILKQVSSQSRIKGFRNYSHGYIYDKVGNTQYLYWSWGNKDLYREKSKEETNKQIVIIFDLLVAAGLGEFIEITNEYRNEKTILLKVS
ncbi:hypothetical protein ACEU2D_18195 [Brevibacillus laterosporus]|uniref:hypothetical protein n=1 Tax=Brevibacillus laterosporus TaxID=1465 RepID=UPI0035A6661E